jgi:tryptophan-rich sensory protein
MSVATMPNAGTRRPSRGQQATVLLLFLVLCLAVEVAAASVTQPAIEPWYRNLAKPAWTPPDQAFPIVWTLLYILMAVAVWQAWRDAPNRFGWPLACFLIQLALNGAWSYVFFGMGEIVAAFLVIMALVLAILATVVTFAQVSRPAAWLMLPYLLWVGYATALNGAIVQMNL